MNGNGRKLHLIAYQIIPKLDGSLTILNSYDHSINSKDPDKLLEFLYKPYRDANSREIKFFYNLDEQLAPLFRLMGEQGCRELLTCTDWKTAGKYYYKKNANFMIKGDVSWDNRNYSAWFYSLNNFFDNDPEPVKPFEVVRLGFKLLDGFRNIGIDEPSSLNSVISTWLNANKGVKLCATIADIPPECMSIVDYAKQVTAHQGWKCNYKIGKFNASNCFDYDLNSAYGFHLSRVRDFKNAEYTPYTKSYAHKSEILKGNVTGYFRVHLTIFDHVKVHPFFYRWNADRGVYPVGEYDTFLMLEEILAIYKYKLGKVEILDGWYVYFKSQLRPMQNIVNRWYGWRDLGEMENKLAKGVIVGFVGKQLEDRGDSDYVSPIYNPLITAYIYSQTRLQVLDFIIENNLEDDLIYIDTDGVTTTRPALKTQIPEKKIMGMWRKNEQEDFIVLSGGWSLHGDKQPHNVTYETLTAAIKKDPGANYYRIPYKKTVTLWEAVERFKNFNLVGTEREFERVVDMPSIMSELNRLFPEYPDSGQELISGKVYESQSIKIRKLEVKREIKTNKRK